METLHSLRAFFPNTIRAMTMATERTNVTRNSIGARSIGRERRERTRAGIVGLATEYSSVIYLDLIRSVITKNQTIVLHED